MLKPAFTGDLTEAGCDEAGRGCLAGPVFASAVILPKDYHHSWLNDSKKLSARQREKLRLIIENESIDHAVALVDNQTIDRINILNASILAMHRAIDKLTAWPQLILVDGNRFKPYPGIPHQCIIKGDATFMSVAAASVLAKTYRDDFMCAIGREFPQYKWELNKGYPTEAHRRAIETFGQSRYHRLSFTWKKAPGLFSNLH